MINVKEFYDILKKNEIEFFTGVPDSLLKYFCAYVQDNATKEKHIIAANEGNSIGLATGYHLATGKIGLVYLQNSGQGNIINPLTSLTDPEVYSIPMLILIGWRGEPGRRDEPQHVKQGKITLELLNTLGIPYQILPESIDVAETIIKKAIESMKVRSAPYALIVKKGTFEEYKLKSKIKINFNFSREESLRLVLDNLNSQEVIVSTTGKTSREIFEYREALGQSHKRDFLTVGSMGHSSQIALGISLSKSKKQVYCIDGDGAIIMHMGTLSTIGQYAQKNFKHIIINNGSHDSVGGQPTAGFDIDIPAIARSNGYTTAFTAKTKEEIKEKINQLKTTEGPALLEIKVNKGARKDLGRPTSSPIKNKEDFKRFLQE